MRREVKSFLFLAGLCFFAIQVYAQTPVRYWDFEGAYPLNEKTTGVAINTNAYKCGVTMVDGVVGKGVLFDGKTCIAQTNALQKVGSGSFSIAFFFRGTEFLFAGFPSQQFSLSLQYPTLGFGSAVKSGNSFKRDFFAIALNGAGVSSYNHLSDGNWHHFVFVYDIEKGEKQVWVDGQLPGSFVRKGTPGERLYIDPFDGFKAGGAIDELAFFNKALNGKEINTLYKKVAALNKGVAVEQLVQQKNNPGSYDLLEFAPGYPIYTVQATDQLRHFPVPRFRKDVSLKRNVSWMDISYLHRELPGPGGAGFGKESPLKAIAISELLAAKWNYYLDIPTVRNLPASGKRLYGDVSTVPGALVKFANEHPEYPVSTILIQAQNSPVYAGFESAKPYVLSQQLPANHYFRNERGQPIVMNGKKWLSPLMPFDLIKRDGVTATILLDQLQHALVQPIALVNENGEVFGHAWKEELLKADPLVWRDYKKTGLNRFVYSARFQYKLDSTYRAEVLKNRSASTRFSFYNVSAMNAGYWPDYAARRDVNRWDHKTVYATPDLYPATPENWDRAKGPFNGYGPVAEGRVQEMKLGDNSFSPFVSAGWGKEEDNLRPAQWLGLLKAMVMLGADFFYTGYFNITGANGKWPNGAGPNDPRGYAYQAAMPAYAQALLSWGPEFFASGTLLNPATKENKQQPFRFKGRTASELILVRKLDANRFLVFGSIQPTSNLYGNAPLVANTSIVLEGRTIRFQIRRQGSVYVFSRNAAGTWVFYQLDGWHQYEHPYYWTRNWTQEAELSTKAIGSAIVTERSQGFDFTRAYSGLLMKKNSRAQYDDVYLDEGIYKVRVLASVRNNASKATIELKAGTYSEIFTFSGKDLNEQVSGNTFRIIENNTPLQIIVTTLDGTLLIDKFLIEKQ
ncbi:MAG: LamG-like jellyroll fold domain-containing protein [Chitinophagaceae bacterium]